MTWKGISGNSERYPAIEKHSESGTFGEVSSEEPVRGPRDTQSPQLTEAGGHTSPFEPRIDYYSPPQAARNIVFVDGPEWFAIDPSSNVYRSTDKGANWTQKGALPAAVNNAFIKLSSGTVIAVCQDQTVQRSTDNGGTWVQVDTLNPVDGTVLQNGIEETSSGNVAFAEYTNTDGEDVRIRRSTDDGQSWTTQLTLTASPSATAHLHCLQYDPHASTESYVAFAHGSGSDGVYISTDECGSFAQYSVDRASGDVNPVDFVFFPDYVAWAYDLSSNAGWFARIPRDDFYAGNLDQSNYEWIGKGTTHKAFYHSFRVSDDLWVYNADAKDRRAGNNEGDNYHHELWAFYANGSRFAKLDTVPASDTNLESTSQDMPRLPGQPRDTADNDFAISIDTQGANRVLTPTSVTYGGQTQKLQSHLIDAQLPNNVPLRALDSSGSPTPLLKVDSFGKAIFESEVGTRGSHAIRDNGLHDFGVNNTTIMTLAAAGALLMEGHLDLRDSTTYSEATDSMTANPETDTEDAYAEINLGGTTYQVPLYSP